MILAFLAFMVKVALTQRKTKPINYLLCKKKPSYCDWNWRSHWDCTCYQQFFRKGMTLGDTSMVWCTFLQFKFSVYGIKQVSFQLGLKKNGKNPIGSNMYRILTRYVMKINQDNYFIPHSLQFLFSRCYLSYMHKGPSCRDARSQTSNYCSN